MLLMVNQFILVTHAHHMSYAVKQVDVILFFLYYYYFFLEGIKKFGINEVHYI